MSDIYLSLTETPTVVTLSQPVVSGVLSSNVTVTNVVSVNVVTMPAITVQAAAPAVTTVAGTVTANVSGLLRSDEGPSGEGVQIYAYDSNSDQARMLRTSDNYPAVLAVDPVSIPPISGTVTASSNLYAFAEDTFQRVGGYPIGSGQTARVSLEVNGPAGVGLPNVSGVPAVPVVGTVTIGSLPAISGTVTANISAIYEGESFFEQADNPMMAVGGLLVSESGSSLNEIRPITIDNNTGSQNVAVKNSVTIGSLPAISGTVTANLRASAPIGAEATPPTIGIALGYGTDSNQFFNNVTEDLGFPVRITAQSQTQPISGTVTAAAPNGSLTTRFGTPTTANTVFATSAVTNGQRKYLLIQNVTTGSNVITVGIGFTPTTTQGIQLTAGAGITFESSYIPTGQIFVLSSVTASNFTILEA